MAIVKAVIDKYESLTAANFPGGSRPPIYFDGVPQADGTGANVAMPYVNLEHEVTEEDADLEGNPIFTARFSLTAYAEKLTDAGAIALAVRYNGAAPTAGSGFHRAASVTVPGYTYMPYSLVITRENEDREKVMGPQVKYVHAVRLSCQANYYKSS